MTETPDLRQRSDALRQRARTILGDTGWLDLFTRRFGKAMLTGSARYDLMVWPDIDIHMPVPASARLDWATLLVDLNAGLEAAGLRLHKAQFLDDYVDPHPLGAGLYWGITFVDRIGTAWKADVWGWELDDFVRRQQRDAELIAALETADRDLILALKSEALARPAYYGAIVTSWDIYQFVLGGAGSTLEELEAWKAARP